MCEVSIVIVDVWILQRFRSKIPALLYKAVYWHWHRSLALSLSLCETGLYGIHVTDLVCISI